LKQDAGLEAFAGLVEEFRASNFAGRRRDAETETLNRHIGELSKQWDDKLPGFPACTYRYGSFKGVKRRGQRDAYLKDVIVRRFETAGWSEGATIVNPVCVLGRHARDVARRLGEVRVIATDIDPRSNRLYEMFARGRTPENYEFRQDNIFEPRVEAEPTAVVFFGACGSLSDAAMDYALSSGARFLICRTCCHENIGGNMTIVKQPTTLNRLFRFKNFVHSKIYSKKAGYYFCDKYAQTAYPRSTAARRIIATEEFIEVARNTVDSDICRSIVDLDRYLFLTEQGYEVWCKGELFMAERSRDVR